MAAEVDKFAFSHMALGYLMKGLACGGPCNLHMATFVDWGRLHTNFWCLSQLLQMPRGHFIMVGCGTCIYHRWQSKENLYRSACWGFMTVMESTHPKVGPQRGPS